MKIDKLIIVLAFITLITFGFQCEENEDDRYGNIYELELPFEIFPVQKQYKINDTLQIIALINDRSLKDLISDNQVAINCTDIPIYFYVGVRVSDFNQLESDDLFEMIIDTNNFKNYHLESNGQYSELKANIAEDILDKGEIDIMKLIPKAKGIFMINPNSYNSIFINSTGDCNATNPILDKGNMNYLFDVVDSNPELINESPLPNNVFISGDKIPILTVQNRIYWFKVSE